MRWRFRPYPKAGTLLLSVLMLLGFEGLALAEDQQVDCVAAAEQAQKFRLDHKLLEARGALLICAQSTCPSVVSTDCVRWLSEVEVAVPSIVLKATGPYEQDLIAVRVWIDGTKWLDSLDGIARPLNPGVHHFRFEAAGMNPVEEQVLIREGETRRILSAKFTPTSLQANPDQPVMARATPVLPLVLGGVGLAALGSFAYFGLSGRAEAHDLADGCGATKSCAQSQVDPVRTKLIVADVSLGVSLVSFGIATYLFVTQQRTPLTESTKLQVTASPRVSSVKLGWSF